MALQIRRGTDAQRLALSGVNLPVVGEPLFTTDTKKLFIGDGSTAGGVALGYYGSIVVSGQGTLSAANNTDVLTVVAGSNIDITTDPATDTMTISAAATFTELKNESIRIFQNNIVGLNSNEDIIMNPSGSGKVDIVGNLSVSGTINGNLSGNVTGNLTGVASSVTSQANSATITASSTNTANQIVLRDASGDFSAGVITASLSGNVTGNVTGVITGSAGSTLSGTVTGVFQTEKLRISDDVITTLNSNENVIIDPAGNGHLIVRSYVRAERLEATQSPLTSGITAVSASPTNAPFVLLTAHNTASTSVTPGGFANTGPVSGSTSVFVRSRGTPLAPIILQANDEIATMDFVGFNGTDYVVSSRMRGVVESVSGSNVAGKIELVTSDSAGSIANRMIVSSSAITGTVPFSLPVVADDTARTALVPTPVKGMLILMESGTTPAATNQAQVFDGTNWVNL